MALRSAWFSEQQAVAIYETELWLVRKTCWTANRRRSLKAFSEILQEEKEHQDSIFHFFERDGWVMMMAPLNRSSGRLLGVALASLPSRISWRVHKMAEFAAEKIYLDAAREVSSLEPREKLLDAAQQERGHALRFDKLLKRRATGRA